MAQSGVATQFPSIGRWIVTGMPARWIFVADFGIRQIVMNSGAVAASVGVGQDTLQSAGELAEYMEKQKKLIEGALKEPRIAGPQATAFAGAEEAHLLFVRHIVSGAGSMLHAQTYVRVGKWVGVITLTTLEDQLKGVRADYDVFVKGLRIRQYSGSEAGASA